jgi:hypothetical protein
MLGFAREGLAPVVAAGNARSVPAGGINDSHSVGLYRQALLTLGDGRLAEQVVLDVVGDCERPETGDRDAGNLSPRTGSHLASSVPRAGSHGRGAAWRRWRAQPSENQPARRSGYERARSRGP